MAVDSFDVPAINDPFFGCALVARFIRKIPVRLVRRRDNVGDLAPDVGNVHRRLKEAAMQLTTMRIDEPDATNLILGQTHFIKSVEDIHEALVGAVPGIKYGLAFCEASGKCLVRCSGTDPAMVQLAQKNASALGVGLAPRDAERHPQGA